MKKLLLFALAGFLIVSAGCSKKQEVNFTPKWDTIRVLKNPDKGWYHHLLDNGIEKYPIASDSIFKTFPGMDHLYLRLAWSYLEPEEGKYNWSRIDEVVEKYVPRGYKISFRISSKETGAYPGSVGQRSGEVHYATPVWVQKAGAKGTVAEVWGTKSWTPDWDDSVYLQKLENFQKAFAAKYDGQPWVSYIDVGSIGEWGEGHTHFSTRIPPTVEEVKANIDIFTRCFKKSLLVCTDDLLYYGKNDSAVNELYKYAVSKGLTLRDDSPLVDWYLDHNLNTWSVSHPQFYDTLYLHRPMVFELQHYGNVKKDGNWLGRNGQDTIAKYGYSGAYIMRKAIETMRATYIGYHGYAEEWLADNPELTNEFANLCGYWYFPVKATFDEKMKQGSNTVSITWLNKGVAPAYKKFGIIFRFTDMRYNSADVLIEDSGNKSWIPKKETVQNYNLLVPEGLSGELTVKCKLVLPHGDQSVTIDLGLQKDQIDENGFFLIGKTNI